MAKVSPHDLRRALYSVWNDDRTPVSMPEADKTKVLIHLTRQMNRSNHRIAWWKIAAAVLLPLLITWGSYWAIVQSAPTAYMTIAAAAGQKSEVVLPDGSKVWLNSQSTLTYPTDFGLRNRNLELVGEGYFEVAHDLNKPFRVATNHIDVVIHGTTFNLSAHPSDSTVSISLLEGSVAIEDKNQSLISMLNPNHTITINRNDLHYAIVKDDVAEVSLWRHNKCCVENATAEEVFKKMGYWYGMNIQLKNSNDTYRYSFTIKNETMRELLELINELTPLEYCINGEEVTIGYK